MIQKSRLDQSLVQRGLTSTRSQAESWIKLGKVTVDGKTVTKPGFFVSERTIIHLKASEQFVSRAGLKLASVARLLKLDFKGRVVLDVGSSTGGFTDYALQHGAKQVIAVDVGTEQLHPTLRGNSKIQLLEKTDIRSVSLKDGEVIITDVPDIVVIDVSFISLREVLPHIALHLSGKQTQIVAMVKPQFEAGKQQVSKGIIKNDTVRRAILKDFESWARDLFVIKDKADSDIAGSKGNRERFYLLQPIHKQ
ncbi:TlyA family rRNA (cytidine-2'-O)-methyltransferase [Candidatus Saccharibacteria bacterium]|nr:MAG: TlyA family rRNA (cytidine-2'-O)-methyltransferase [Candidatus Saccharibacteria bacterium]